ncbi:hypothetical protein PIB30_030171 [Stylosanthes scabra]|uniref:Uncharacterized protein n=1 Tax=Stylosanthes scabra TaxID=79078 RepID=A0ABU6RBS9_9FABA|nr:hypothetical protein [Stylosanthes scabra]
MESKLGWIESGHELIRVIFLNPNPHQWPQIAQEPHEGVVRQRNRKREAEEGKVKVNSLIHLTWGLLNPDLFNHLCNFCHCWPLQLAAPPHKPSQHAALK